MTLTCESVPELDKSLGWDGDLGPGGDVLTSRSVISDGDMEAVPGTPPGDGLAHPQEPPPAVLLQVQVVPPAGVKVMTTLVQKCRCAGVRVICRCSGDLLSLIIISDLSFPSSGTVSGLGGPKEE